MDIAEALRTLGLPPTAADEMSLQRAWRRFARAHHPDRCPGDPEAGARFARGKEAYETLRALAAGHRRGLRRPSTLCLVDLRRQVISSPSATRARLYEPAALVGREWIA